MTSTARAGARAGYALSPGEHSTLAELQVAEDGREGLALLPGQGQPGESDPGPGVTSGQAQVWPRRLLREGRLGKGVTLRNAGNARKR
jgi:hypothetical protein